MNYQNQTPETRLKQIKLTDCIGPAFYGLYHAVMQHAYTYYWLCGGRGSFKSSFTAIVAILLLINNPAAHVAVIRKRDNTLRKTVYEQMLWAIEKLGLTEFFIARLSPLEIIYKPTGQKINFFGLSDSNTLKSIKVSNGYYSVLWFEELAEYDGMEEVDNARLSFMRGGDKFWVFYTYNPPQSLSSWVNVETQKKTPEKIVHKSNYLYGPAEWVGPMIVTEAETLRKFSPRRWRHVFLGDVTGTGGEVFMRSRETDCMWRICTGCTVRAIFEQWSCGKTYMPA